MTGYLTTYSLFPNGYGEMPKKGVLVGKERVYVGGEPATWNGDLVHEQFLELGMSKYENQALLDNLMDYADRDQIPRDAYSFCTEATLLINEIVLSNTVAIVGASNYVHQLDISAEVWFPFVGVDRSDPRARIGYTLRADAEFQSGTGGFVPVPVGQPSYTFAPKPQTWPEKPIRVGLISFLRKYKGPPPSMPKTLRLELKLFQGAGLAGDLVDAIEPFDVRWADHLVAKPPVAGSVTKAYARCADDPRLNWSWDRHWVQAKPSLGKLNPSASHAAGDGTTDIYVKDAPMDTVGELGFLLYDQARPWQTIKLHDIGSKEVDTSRVLDRFTVTTNAYRRGLVNPNTPWPEVLANAFLNVPCARYPGEKKALYEMEQAPAAELAASVAGAAAKQQYVNRSDAAKAVGTVASRLTVGGGKKLEPGQVEGLIRNSIGLLDPRQNLFGIYLTTWAETEDMEGSTVARSFHTPTLAHAFALVWRDPYAVQDAAGKWIHRTQVTYYKRFYDM
jgi:hypothetical protein